MSRRMDPGLGTSERAMRSQSMFAAPTQQVVEVGTITCHSCRARLAEDEIDSHECSEIAPSSPTSATGSPASRKLSDAAPRAESLFSSFLNSSPLSPSLTETRRADLVVDTTPMATATIVAAFAPAKTPPPAEAVFIAPPHPTRSLSVFSATPTTGSDAPRPATPDALMFTAPNVLSALASRSRAASDPGAILPASPIQCRVRGVRVNKNRVAVYSIISNVARKAPTSSPTAIAIGLLPFSSTDVAVSATTSGRPPTPGRPSTPTSKAGAGGEIVVERRYREFYAFALNVYAMFPSRELWQRLPPKTYCSRPLTDGFLIRRKNGLDDFVRRAIELMDLGSQAHGSIAQWYLVRLFLNISPTAMPRQTKDRSLTAAMTELNQLAQELDGWTSVGRVMEDDAVYERVGDGFPIVKRVHLCRFPARAVFDMIVQRAENVLDTNNVSSSSDSEADVDSGGDLSGDAVHNEAARPQPWDPVVESHYEVRRENASTWVERTVYKRGWMMPTLRMTSLKTWKVDDDGTIAIVMIPADESDWSDTNAETVPNTGWHRADCILGGWLLTPTPQEETCTVTWIMQVNFGACHPLAEFTSTHGLQSLVARRTLLTWADEIVHLLTALETGYDPDHYREIGPILSDSAFQKLQLDQPEPTTSVLQDPRVYAIARQLEPSLCLLVHKNSNRNVLVVKVNLTNHSISDVDPSAPLKVEWIMFEKPGNPRQDLSAIERNTTFNFSTRHMATNVHRFTLDLLRRDCVLRYDPKHGYALFTTINGKPNMLLKRVFLNYAKAPRIGFAKLEEVSLVGESEIEVLSMATAK